MADTPKSKSYTVTFEGDDIESFENMSELAGMEPEQLLRYALGAYTFITLAMAQGSTLYLDDSELVFDTEDDEEEIEFILETEEDEPEEGVDVKLLVFQVIESGRKD